VNNKTKERIVGSVVLLCLAIIFIPPFYDGRDPFKFEKDQSLSQIPKPPHFKETEDSAADIAPIGSGRIDEIEGKVKSALPESARSDTQFATVTSNSFSEKIEAVNAGEMTEKLLNQISKNSQVSAKFNSKSTVKQAWAVQVGSFEDSDRAIKLRDDLIANKFQAYIKTVSKDGVTLLRVFAGVSLDKSVAEKIKHDLENNYSLTTVMVVPYQP